MCVCMCVFTNALAWVWELWYLECCSLFPSCRAGNQTQVNRHRGKHINPLLIRLGVRSKKHYSEWNLQSDRLIHLIHTTSSSSVLQSASFLQLRIDPLLTCSSLGDLGVPGLHCHPTWPQVPGRCFMNFLN